MRIRGFQTKLIGCALIALASTFLTGSVPAPTDAEALREAIAKIAKIQGPSPEETTKQRNERLDQLFRQHTLASGGEVTGASIRRFHDLVKQAGLTCFDDFLAAMITPLRYVIDPVTGDRVPVLGPLGSDNINPWLAAMGVSEGKPLDEQPMYNLAADVLREHIDFSVIGTRDPNLSFDMIPLELHENAQWAYRRLNPTNRFDGGFDQPLFYVTVREAVKKLFRQDYPAAKLTMADIVVSRDQGGFGIKSCLLCHNRDHAGVYARLVGQSFFYQAKATAASEADNALADGLPTIAENAQELRHAKDMAAMFQQAADHILKDYPDKIDPDAVRAALGPLSVENLNRLKPGFDEFYEVLDDVGCTMCHSSFENPSPEKNPAKFNAFVLTPNNYFKTRNIVALSSLIDLQDLSKSTLLAKAAGKVPHRGKDELQLDAVEIQELYEALDRWVHSLEPRH